MWTIDIAPEIEACSLDMFDCDTTKIYPCILLRPQFLIQLRTLMPRMDDGNVTGYTILHEKLSKRKSQSIERDWLIHVLCGLISPLQFERDVSSPHFTSYFANLFILFVVHRHQSSSSACLWCGWHLRWTHRGPGNQIQCSWVTGPFRWPWWRIFSAMVRTCHCISFQCILHTFIVIMEIFLAGVKRNEFLVGNRAWKSLSGKRTSSTKLEVPAFKVLGCKLYSECKPFWTRI